MPKGAHFKKDNPRIIQVSFKVNATEHEKIKNFAAKQNLSLPEWMRMRLVDDDEFKQTYFDTYRKTRK